MSDFGRFIGRFGEFASSPCSSSTASNSFWYRASILLESESEKAENFLGLAAGFAALSSLLGPLISLGFLFGT